MTEYERVIEITSNVGADYILGSQHPMHVRHDQDTREPRPYLELGEGLRARIIRNVYYELVELALAEAADADSPVSIWSDGVRFPL